MKTVYSSDELPHVWARQSQGSARNSSGSMSFNSDGFFSYRATIGMFWEGYVLLSSGTYSVTTAYHQSRLAAAVQHHNRKWLPDFQTVANVLRCGKHDISFAIGYVEARRQEVERLEGKLSKARAEHMKLSYMTRINDAQEAARFVWQDLQGMKTEPFVGAGKAAQRVHNEKVKANFERILHMLQEYAQRDPEQLLQSAKREVEAIYHGHQGADATGRLGALDLLSRLYRAPSGLGPLAVKEAQKVVGKAAIADYRAVETQCDVVYAPTRAWLGTQRKGLRVLQEAEYAEKVEAWYAGGYQDLHSMSTTLCRVIGDTVQTSKGARVPLQDALKIAKVALKVAKTCVTYRPAKPVEVGDYTLRQIDGDGTLRIDCHVIPLQSILTCAEKAGIALA